MDWNPTELAEAVAQGAKAVLEAEPTGWAALIEAGLLDFDDVLADVALLTEVGATGAFVPAFETLCLGWPAREAAGRDVVLTGILEGNLSVTDSRLTGTAHGVPCADRAQQVVVAASGGVWLASIADAQVEAGVATNEDPAYSLTFDGAPVSQLGGADLLAAWRARVQLGLAALRLGLCRRAIALTADYVGKREQFNRKIGTFQAVGQRLADAWIDLQGMDVTLTQAAWRVANGLPAERELLIAAWQSAEGAHRITAAAQHLHGGFGYDRDYPLHRTFLTARRWAFLLGGPASHLQALGDLLATQPQDER